MLQVKTAHSAFLIDEKGTIALLFGLALFVICVALGLAVDGGRAYTAREKTATALDAAALAAAKMLQVNAATDAQIIADANAFFKDNIALSPTFGAKHGPVRVTIDRVTKTVTVSVDMKVPTFFGHFAQLDKFTFTSSSQATFGVTDLELGLVLDTTGSMKDPSNSGTGQAKIDELKAAASDMFDQLLPNSGVNGSVRIGIAPFSASVNAGPFARQVSNGASTDGCVVERSGIDAFTDKDPVVAGDSLMPGNSNLNDIDPTEGLPAAPDAYRCEQAPVLPLTSDKAALKAEVNSFRADYWTAGHIGTAWGWYLISPNWNRVWPAASRPVAYGTRNVVKSIVVMTDGIYNTAYYNGATAAQQAIDLCNNAKAKGVVVYTIGFTAPVGAEATLKACASIDPKTGKPSYYRADSKAELSTAFSDIATKLTALRIDQ